MNAPHGHPTTWSLYDALVDELPTRETCSAAVQANQASPLEHMLHSYEPEDHHDAKLFRVTLAAVMIDVLIESHLGD